MEERTHSMRQSMYLANFLLSVAGTIMLYTNSSFIDTLVGEELVGVMYAVSAVASIALLSYAGRMISRMGNRTFFLFFGAFYTVSLSLLVLPVANSVKVFAFVSYLAVGGMLVFSLNIFFEHLSTLKNRGKMRGIFLLLGSTGVMLGPLLSARAIAVAGYAGTYALGALIFALLALIVQFGLKKYTDAPYAFGRIYSAVKHTLHETTLRSVIAANFILQFFYAWMVVYTPIYLSVHLGLSWSTIGIMFAVMLSAFVILDYPLGKLADYLGSEKELAAIGFLIMAACVFGLAFLPVSSVFMLGALLFFSRVGAATVETMTEIHFFKVAEESDPGLLSLFCDLRPLSYLVAPLLGVLALAFLPFKMIFAVLGAILILGFFIALYMEKTRSWWERAHVEVN